MIFLFIISGLINIERERAIHFYYTIKKHNAQFLYRPQFHRVKRQIGGLLGNLFGRINNNQRPAAAAQGLNNVDVTRFVQPATAPRTCQNNEETLPCDNTSPFRKFSGWCNNLRNPSFGKSLTPFNRLLPAGYDDGIARPRWRSSTGQPLPSPRLISVVVHQVIFKYFVIVKQ